MEKVLILNEQKHGSRGDILSFIAEELSFPEYFGYNLDALVDCLREIDVPTNIALIPVQNGESAEWYQDICEAVFDVALENENLHLFGPLYLADEE